VNDQETEKSALCSKVGATGKKKKRKRVSGMNGENIILMNGIRTKHVT
jgi:hypothetical protein